MRGQGWLAGSLSAAHGTRTDSGERRARAAAEIDGRGGATGRSLALALGRSLPPRPKHVTLTRPGPGSPPCPIPLARHPPPSRTMPCAAGRLPAN